MIQTFKRYFLSTLASFRLRGKLIRFNFGIRSQKFRHPYKTVLKVKLGLLLPIGLFMFYCVNKYKIKSVAKKQQLQQVVMWVELDHLPIFKFRWYKVWIQMHKSLDLTFWRIFANFVWFNLSKSFAKSLKLKCASVCI